MITTTMFLALLLCFFTSASATTLQFNNASFSSCLSTTVISPKYTPQDLTITYDTVARRINYVLLGNMTGEVDDTNSENTLASAITNTVSVAGYTQIKTQNRLCNVSFDPFSGLNQSYCPFGPGKTLLMFDVQLEGSYMFSSITSTIRLNGPTSTNYMFGCIQTTFSPPLSRQLKDILTYIPLMILILVGVKVVAVVVLNPWSGTLDPFRGFSNFGMEFNALRMVTPGFSDCLLYIQFIAYSSMLALNYPGFLQLITSRIGWSMLAFSTSPISSTTNYTPQGSTSLTSYINHVGELRQDAWKSFMVWWLILQACVIALVLVILLVWFLLTPASTELTRKNIPFLAGSMLRIYYWLLLPLTTFTSFQLVTAQQAHAAAVALAAVVLMFLIILGPLCLMYFLPRHRPKQDLHEDLAVLNMWGPLYNTFTAHPRLFFVINMTLLIFRGLVVGFLQQYGTAQLILLLVLEAGNIITLGILRPWQNTTNTTFFNLVVAGFRFVILVLSITFIPSVGILEERKEWIGYIILILHAIVLVFLFLGNALLTLLELLIRLLVIVPQDEGAKAIFGARQLRSRRKKRTTETTTMTSSGSSAGLLDSNPSPFFRTPRQGSTSFRPLSTYTDLLQDDKSETLVRAHSFASQEILHTKNQSSSSIEHELSLAPTEDAARRGVDYAVREADIYHPQSGQLLGPSKKLGTGPADPTGVKFRRWTPWRQNPDAGKFVVVRSSPVQLEMDTVHEEGS